MSFYYVYAYFEEGHARPFYIGKGHGNRAWEHICPSAQQKTPFQKKVKKMLSEGYKPEIELLVEGLTEEEAFAEERRLIRFFGKVGAGGSLLNLTDGGEGISGHRHSEATRRKIRNSLSNLRPRTKEHNQLISLALRGNKNGAGQIPVNRRPVVGYLLGFRKEYDCISHVERDGYNASNVASCLSGKRKRAHNLFWKYL